MEIKNIFLHHIDTAKDCATPVEIDENSVNLKKYATALAEEISKQSNKRDYTFKDGNTEVKTSLKLFIEATPNIEQIILNNANRLLEKERNSQAKMERLDIEIQKGSLLHLHFINEETHQIIICKLEHDEILSEANFNYVKGLNTKRKIYKAIHIFLDELSNVTNNYVLDKNSSKYWWEEFLELKQNRSDADNTLISLNEIDKILTRQRKKYYGDYLIVRNAVIGYYRTKETFNFSDMIDDIFTTYEPLNVDFPLKSIAEKIKELPEKKGFDTQFGVDKKSINKKVKHTIRLAPNIYLNIDDYVENLRNVIEPVEENGDKFLKIYSTDGYNILKDFLNKKA